MKTYIISNRLPVKFVENEKEGLQVVKSEGGLATGLASLDGENYWIGWPGISTDCPDKQNLIYEKLGKSLRPVFLSEEEIDLFYRGFSNETIWPLFHSFTETASFKKDYWECYKKVNQKFAEALLEVVEPGDKIWIQDYHLMLLPQMLKKELPENPIAFFLHIPFPPTEIFKNLPWREEILQGLLGSDLIGFHTEEYLQSFRKSVKRILQLNTDVSYTTSETAAEIPTTIKNSCVSVKIGNREVLAKAFPMGIDFDKFNNSINDKEVCEQLNAFKEKFGDFKLMLSVDRLDYTKGIPQRIKAFDSLLKQNPELQGKVSMVVLVVPSRDKVPRYRMLKEEIDELIGKINGRYSTLEWTPIHYFYRSLPFNQLTALYNLCDIGVVTPYRDGMNLVSKEYVASKTERNKPGVLILSEMAGAASELTQALMVNPFNEDEIVKAMYQAIHMPESKQKKAIWLMQQTIKDNTVKDWAANILQDLEELFENHESQNTYKIIGINRKMNKTARRELFRSGKDDAEYYSKPVS